MKYDVTIIGGGLAGLSLAIDLRKRGYTIVVIEKGDYPRNKVCGEYISMESYDYLKTICPELKNRNLPLINKFKLSSIGEREFKTILDLGGFGISRYLLENLLFIEAKNLGVVFALNEKALEVKFDFNTNDYSVTTNSNNYISTIVCNSSGRKSNFEAKENISSRVRTNYIGVKYHIKMERDATQIEIHNFPGGYCGISNVEDGKSCLCYIVNSKMLNNAGNSILELEKKYLHQNKNLKRIFDTAEFITKVPVTISGINFRIKVPIYDSVFYLGDSAGSIAPITGNGMSICFKSASVLASNLDNYFSSKISKQQLIENYKLFWNKEFSMRIKLSRYFQKLSEFSFLTKLSIQLFNLFPSLANRVIKLTHGKPF
ncbi:MAG: NAD(P)/FAD-dependent oxidoreductase [Bacteroidota bacterium]|nr:NAD(P)/FAD-dependent oxidoreductase [Bacteroidota bacterium]MDP3144393.1 NAD(P)/FAD-dependent oxidoreductase [Bacteroidota bacterium]